LKTLLKNEADMFQWLSGLIDDVGSLDSVFGCIEEIEGYFGIDLLDERGRTFEEVEMAEELDEWEQPEWTMASPLKFNLNPRYDSVGLPASYPCLAVTFFDSTWDRVGDITIRALQYVYPEDMLA
jgi:hypothetical protein